MISDSVHKIKLIVGLGNAEKEYHNTRHNVGQWFIKKVAKHFNLSLNYENKFEGFYGSSASKILFFFPNTSINNSGLPIYKITKFYKINTNQILIAHDDLDITCGEIRLKVSGGHGGHNGLRNINQHIGNNYYRLRIGIGHPGDKRKVTNYVLTRPSTYDEILINKAIENSIIDLNNILIGDFHKFMNNIHRKKEG